MEEEKKLQQLITFKKNEKYIYDEIQKHSGKGNWVKDVLIEHMRMQEGIKIVKSLIGEREE